MKFDLLSLGDHLPDPHSGEYHDSQSDRHLLWTDLGITAERLGFDGFWLGEHHASDYILSSPQMVLAAVAARTERVRLGTGVSLLPNNDPVRLAEDFATLDLLSRGRAEIGFGSGITAHTFHLFGQDVETGGERAAENLELIQRLWNERRVSWAGRFRSAIDGTELQPRTFSGRAIPINRGVATNEATAREAGLAGHRLMCMTIAGPMETAGRLAAIYREAYREAGHDPAGESVAAIARLHVQPDGDTARRFWKPYMDSYLAFSRTLLSTRGATAGIREVQRQAAAQPAPAADDYSGFPALCGSPRELVDWIRDGHRVMGGFDRFIGYFDLGGLPRNAVMDAVTLFAEEVMPALAAV
ncbi:MAG: LLM class flavin-dependent oxidoreductase [Pseudomonadota bacterium]